MSEKNQSAKAPAANSSTDAAKELEAMHAGTDDAQHSAQQAIESGDTSPEGGNAEVQDHMDVINEQGYMGVKVDPTPNENYTLRGAAEGLPTPETDPEQGEKARAHAAKVARGAVEPDSGKSK
jgi:hypothetical protein